MVTSHRKLALAALLKRLRWPCSSQRLGTAGVEGKYAMRVQYVDVRRLSVGSNMALLLKPPCAFESEFLRLAAAAASVRTREESLAPLPCPMPMRSSWFGGRVYAFKATAP